MATIQARRGEKEKIRRDFEYSKISKGEDLSAMLEQDAILEYKKKRREDRSEDSGDQDNRRKSKVNEFEQFKKFYRGKLEEKNKRLKDEERRRRREM